MQELAPSAFVSRAETSSTETLGSTAVGAPVPRPASRSVCQSHTRPTIAIALDAYFKCSDAGGASTPAP